MFRKKSGMLFEPSTSKFPLQDIDEPNLLREQFPYTDIPRMTFDGKQVDLSPPRNIWITDTTFRDGQQSRPPFTAQQIVALYSLLHKLNGESRLIRQSEFFLYSNKDKEAVEECLALDYRYPEVTGWIRARKEDFQIVKSIGLKETGILTSCSDYHIFLKLKMRRRECMESYLEIVKRALDEGIRPRCHFEDVTRADIYGFVIPFAMELMRLRESYGMPVKIRLCDTMGFGVPYPEATLPRSVPKLIAALTQDAGVPNELLEWHGHNDFHRSHVNSVTCWLYGCSSVNCALLGLGERTGNSPLEAAVIDYISLVGHNDGIETTVITEIASYFKTNLNFKIPGNMPLVGENFNMTAAGIHADGLLKNEEIYNVFDTETILNRPPGIVITDKTGVAGVAHWVNSHLALEPNSRLPKSHPDVIAIHDWITNEYEKGRITNISNEEMLHLAKMHLPDYFVLDLNQLKEEALSLVGDLTLSIASLSVMKNMDKYEQEKLLHKTIREQPFINLMLVANVRGEKHTNFITRDGVINPSDEAKLDTDYSNRGWFKKPLETRNLYVSDLFTSKITKLLGFTVSAPIVTDDGDDAGVLRIDLRFEDLLKRVRGPEE